jgi:hypothetical protein
VEASKGEWAIIRIKNLDSAMELLQNKVPITVVHSEGKTVI